MLQGGLVVDFERRQKFHKHQCSLHATDIIYFHVAIGYYIRLTAALDFRQTPISNIEFMALLDIMSLVSRIRFMLPDQLSSINTSAPNVTQRLWGYFQRPFFKIKGEKKIEEKSMRVQSMQTLEHEGKTGLVPYFVNITFLYINISIYE